jgi:hypothetical protein
MNESIKPTCLCIQSPVLRIQEHELQHLLSPSGEDQQVYQNKIIHGIYIYIMQQRKTHHIYIYIYNTFVF